MLLILALHGAAPAAAVSLGFECLTHDRAGDCAIGAAQLSVDVADAGNGQIAFVFRNQGSGKSSITDVYWDDDALLRLLSISGTPGAVEFSQFASPANVPGANQAAPRFVTSYGLSADSDAPVQPMGVNPGESLTVTFVLIGGKTFATALSDLADGRLRVAIHVQGFASGGSESFVSRPSAIVPIPEPGSFVLVAAGLFALARARRGLRS